MQSRMDWMTSDERSDRKPRKKYEITLRKDQFKILQNSTKAEPLPSKTSNISTDSVDSQNFRLRISDSFDSGEIRVDEAASSGASPINTKKTEVILISDSSDDDTQELLEWLKYRSSEYTKATPPTPSRVYVISSSDSEDYESINILPKSQTPRKDTPVNEMLNKCSISYTSDENPSASDSDNCNNDKENYAKFRSPSREGENSNTNLDKFHGILTSHRSNINIPKSRVTPTGEKNVQETGKIFTSHRVDTLGRTKSPQALPTTRVTPIGTKNIQETGKSSSKSDKYRGIFTPNRVDLLEHTNNTENIPKARVTSTSSKSVQEKKKCSSKIYKNREIFTSHRVDTPGSTKSLQDPSKSRPTPTPKNIQESEKSSSKSEKFPGISTSSSKIRVTPTASAIPLRIERSGSKNQSISSNKNRFNTETPGSTERARNTTPISARITSRAVVLTSQQTRDILKVIRSKRAVFDSPNAWKKTHSSSSSEIEESNISESANGSPENKMKTENRVIIDETDSDSDDKVIQGSKVDLTKPFKTHVSRFLDPTIADDACVDMSEKKKLEIAQWILANSVNSRDDSSISAISASQKNSPNSGNSSLDRLELNYETPNNRDKMRKVTTDERANNFTPKKSKSSVKSRRQTTIDNFIRTSDDGQGKIYTPVSTAVAKEMDNVPPAEIDATQDVGIDDCAAILDKFYGNVWREKADELFTATEPRKKNVLLVEKAVQTETKVKPKRKGVKSSSSSADDGFQGFVKNIRSNLNSTKKTVGQINPRKCSFINDLSSSGGSGGESSYRTALTNPRTSDELKILNNPLGKNTPLHRVLEICDSDSADEVAPSPVKLKDYRRQLSYSEDGNDSVSSEYDPQDIIPPKSVTKTPGVAKPVRKLLNVPTSAKVAQRIEKPKSFLASLCATVPINEAHPDAKKYRQNYKNTKEELCKYLYKLYNEKIFDNKLPEDMTIEWNVRMRGTAGYCYNKRSVKALGGITRSSRMVLATKILDTPDRLRDTLVHEMCHAAAWLINEVSDGHGPFWKAWASKAVKAFPELPPIQRCHDYKIKTKFTYRCTGCGYSIGRHSKSLDIDLKRCGHCYGKFEVLINRVTKSGTVQQLTPTTKKPTPFALYVKDNYQTVKKERKGVAHKEVMQILGQQFSAIKITKKKNSDDDNFDNAPEAL